MKAIPALLSISFMFATAAQAKTVSAYSCRAVCVGVDWSEQTLSSLGSIRQFGATRDEAFDRLSHKCEKSYSRMNIDTAFLIKNGLSIDRSVHTSSTSSSSAAAAAVRTWNFVGLAASSASSYSLETETHLHFKLDLISERDCRVVRVDDTELVPEYDGELWVGG